MRMFVPFATEITALEFEVRPIGVTGEMAGMLRDFIVDVFGDVDGDVAAVAFSPAFCQR